LLFLLVMLLLLLMVLLFLLPRLVLCVFHGETPYAQQYTPLAIQLDNPHVTKKTTCRLNGNRGTQVVRFSGCGALFTEVETIL
jgi:hypothetical protein